MLENLLAPKRYSKKDTVINIITTLLGSVVIILALLILIFSVSFSHVSGDSMLSTIYDGEYIMCIRPDSLKRGDIVVAETDSKDLIKRIVALPGQRLVFLTMGDGIYPYTDEEKVYLYLDAGNGFELVDETEFINNEKMTEWGFANEKKFADHEYKLFSGNIADLIDDYIITLGEGEYFLMGDNRDHSTDSRNYGPFTKSRIKGKAVQIFESGTAIWAFLDFIYSPFSCNN